MIRLSSCLILALLSCSSGETFAPPEYHPLESGESADAATPDPHACVPSLCTDSYVLCEYCKCPGEKCTHRDYVTGQELVVGVCGEDLECSAPCPSTHGCPP